MPASLLALVCALLVALSARAAPSDPVVAIAAVPFDPRVPAAVSGQLGGLLTEELSRAGFRLLDPRQVDLRLAERADLLAGCQKEEELLMRCVRAQARLLGVSRVVLPRARPLADGLELALTLFSGDVPERLEREVEVVEACRGCQGAALRASVARLARAIRPMNFMGGNDNLRGVMPAYVNAAGGDYHLRPDAAVNRMLRRPEMNPAVLFDIDDDPRPPGGVDIGADQIP